jgi:hypothetical protein
MYRSDLDGGYHPTVTVDGKCSLYARLIPARDVPAGLESQSDSSLPSGTGAVGEKETAGLSPSRLEASSVGVDTDITNCWLVLLAYTDLYLMRSTAATTDSQSTSEVM